MNLVQFKRHDGDGDVFINPAHVAMVEQSGTGDANVTHVVVAAQAGAGARSRPRTPTDPTRRWTMRRASQTAATDEPGPLLLQLPVLLAARLAPFRTGHPPPLSTLCTGIDQRPHVRVLVGTHPVHLHLAGAAVRAVVRAPHVASAVRLAGREHVDHLHDDHLAMLAAAFQYIPRAGFRQFQRFRSPPIPVWPTTTSSRIEWIRAGPPRRYIWTRPWKCAPSAIITRGAEITPLNDPVSPMRTSSFAVSCPVAVPSTTTDLASTCASTRP